MRDAQSWNRYSYVQNDPLTLIDPLGLFAEQVCRDYSVAYGYVDDDGNTHVAESFQTQTDCYILDNGIIDLGSTGLAAPIPRPLPELKGSPNKVFSVCPSPLRQAAAIAAIASDPALLGAAAQAELLAKLTGRVSIVGLSASKGFPLGSDFLPRFGGAVGGSVGLAADPLGNLGLAYGWRIGGGSVGKGFNVGGSMTLSTRNTSIFQMSGSNVLPQGSVSVPVGEGVAVSVGGNVNGSFTVTVGTGGGVFGTSGGVGKGSVAPLVCVGN